MTSQICLELEMLLISDTVLVDRDAFFGRIEAMPGAGEHIVDGLARSVEVENWWLAGRYVLAAFSHPSGTLTPMLCDLLNRRSPWLNNGDIVDVLAEIGDPLGVDAIANCLHWALDAGERYHVAIKCVWALGAIGSDPAIEVLKEVAGVGPSEVRRAAMTELSHLGLWLNGLVR